MRPEVQKRIDEIFNFQNKIISGGLQIEDLLIVFQPNDYVGKDSKFIQLKITKDEKEEIVANIEERRMRALLPKDGHFINRHIDKNTYEMLERVIHRFEHTSAFMYCDEMKYKSIFDDDEMAIDEINNLCNYQYDFILKMYKMLGNKNEKDVEFTVSDYLEMLEPAVGITRDLKLVETEAITAIFKKDIGFLNSELGFTFVTMYPNLYINSREINNNVDLKPTIAEILSKEDTINRTYWMMKLIGHNCNYINFDENLSTTENKKIYRFSIETGNVYNGTIYSPLFTVKEAMEREYFGVPRIKIAKVGPTGKILKDQNVRYVKVNNGEKMKEVPEKEKAVIKNILDDYHKVLKLKNKEDILNFISTRCVTKTTNDEHSYIINTDDISK